MSYREGFKPKIAAELSRKQEETRLDWTGKS